MSFWGGRVLSKRMKCLIVLFASLLVSCGDPVNIIEPVDVSIPDQSVKFKFSVKEKSRYRFGFLFPHNGWRWSEDCHSESAGNSLYGNQYLSGEILPVHLKLFRNGSSFFDGVIDTSGTRGSYCIYIENRIDARVIRNIKEIDLPSGDYSGEVITTKSLPEFDGVSTYIQVVNVSPEENFINKSIQMKRKQRMSRDRYLNWLLTKWIVRDLYRIWFCPDFFSAHKKINVNQKGESVRFDFNVSKNGYYDVLFFLDLNDKERILECATCSFSDVHRSYPFLISFSKNGKFSFEREFIAHSAGYMTGLHDENGYFTVYAYNLRRFYLRPGKYSIVVKTKEVISGVEDIKSFISLSETFY